MKASVYGFVASGVAIEKSDDKPSPNLSYVTHFVPQLTLTAPRASISGISQSLASCGTSHPLSQRRRVARSHEGAGNRGSWAKGMWDLTLLSLHVLRLYNDFKIKDLKKNPIVSSLVTNLQIQRTAPKNISRRV